MIKIATWNVNSIRVRLIQVLDWLQAESPDILALQEIKIVNEKFPVQDFQQLGYQVLCNGQKTYNGVATLSRAQADDVMAEFPDWPDPQRRVLFGRYNKLAVLNLYVPNGMAVGSEKYAYKLDWLSHLQTFVQERLALTDILLLLGDFNIAPTDADVHDPAEWQGQVLVSEPERKHFFRLLDKGLVDCYRLFKQEAGCYSWWDYRASGFERNRGLRIDHILASNYLAERCTACRIDTVPRGRERPSDHAPVVAEFDL